MGDKNQTEFEDDDLGSTDDFDDDDGDGDGDFDESSAEAEETPADRKAEEERRRRARREIEKRNELKALRSELDEWDDILDEDDL